MPAVVAVMEVAAAAAVVVVVVVVVSGRVVVVVVVVVRDPHAAGDPSDVDQEVRAFFKRHSLSVFIHHGFYTVLP